MYRNGVVESRSRRQANNNNYLPPFLGGPIDEIFLRGPQGTQRLVSPRSPWMRPVKKLLSGDGDTSHGHKKSMFDMTATTEYQRNANNLRRARDTELEGRWVRVRKVPFHLFYLIYHFFTSMGAKKSIPVRKEHTFYVYHTKPKDTAKALTFGQRCSYFLDQLVFLNCDILEESDINNLDLDEDDYLRPAPENFRVNDRLQVKYRYEKEYRRQYENDNINWHAVAFGAGPRGYFDDLIENWSKARENIKRGVHWLKSTWHWTKDMFDHYIVSFLLHITHEILF